MKVTYTPEAIADLIELLTYLSERNPLAVARLERRIYKQIDRLATREFEGPEERLRSGRRVRGWAVPPLRIYYQRHPDELLVVRIYHQARRPISRRPRRQR